MERVERVLSGETLIFTNGQNDVRVFDNDSMNQGRWRFEVQVSPGPRSIPEPAPIPDPPDDHDVADSHSWIITDESAQKGEQHDEGDEHDHDMDFGHEGE